MCVYDQTVLVLKLLSYSMRLSSSHFCIWQRGRVELGKVTVLLHWAADGEGHMVMVLSKDEQPYHNEYVSHHTSVHCPRYTTEH